MALSPADAARLQQLRIKRDQAIGGGQITKVASAGRSMDMTAASLDSLTAEIDALEAAAQTPTGRIRRRGAVTFRIRPR